MKAIIITLFVPVLMINTGDIDYNHKKIAREISKTLDIDKFELAELPGGRYSEDASPEPGRFFRVESESTGDNFIYVGRVFTCPAGGCDDGYDFKNTNEYFDYMIVFSEEAIVLKVSVFNYQATHGQEICSRGWLRQFIGITPGASIKVGKNIDAISGATKSTHSIVEDIKKKSKVLGDLIN